MLNLLLGTPVFLFLYTGPVRDDVLAIEWRQHRREWPFYIDLHGEFAVVKHLGGFAKKLFQSKQMIISRSWAMGVAVSLARQGLLEEWRGTKYMEGQRGEAGSGEQLLLFIHTTTRKVCRAMCFLNLKQD